MQIAKLVLISFVFALGTARAAPKGAPAKPVPDAALVAKAKPYVVAGDTAYKLGKFSDALTQYSKAYEIYPAPALLFNIGQCQRNLKDFEKAIFSYESYLRSTPAAANRALVEDLITESRVLLKKQRDDQAAADARARGDADAERNRKELDAQRAADEAARQRAVAESEKIAAARAAGAEADRRRQGRVYRKWWFWTAIGAVAAAAGGTAYYYSGDTTYVDPMGSLGGLDRR